MFILQYHGFLSKNMVVEITFQLFCQQQDVYNKIIAIINSIQQFTYHNLNSET